MISFFSERTISPELLRIESIGEALSSLPQIAPTDGDSSDKPADKPADKQSLMGDIQQAVEKAKLSTKISQIVSALETKLNGTVNEANDAQGIVYPQLLNVYSRLPN